MASKDEPSAAASIATEIREYLARHPRAADTLEGIGTWWLRGGSYRENAQDLQDALDQLVADDTLHAVVGPDGRTLYRARSDRGDSEVGSERENPPC